MMKGLASDKLAKAPVAPHCFALLAALALGLVLGLPAAARCDGDPLDVATLRVRLKDTPAIGLVEKLHLKSEIEDLVNDLAAFHAGRATRRSYELHAVPRLVLRIIALLEQRRCLARARPHGQRSSLGDARRPRTVRLAGEKLTAATSWGPSSDARACRGWLADQRWSAERPVRRTVR
jgi:hypothetical protein